MAYENILPPLYEVLRPFVRTGEPVGEQTELMTDLGLDSMQLMQLLQEIEDRFDISIPLNVLPEVRTVEDLARQIDALIRQTT